MASDISGLKNEMTVNNDRIGNLTVDLASVEGDQTVIHSNIVTNSVGIQELADTVASAHTHMNTESLTISSPGPRSDWQAHIFGMTWRPDKGGEPSKFRMILQTLLLDVKWTNVGKLEREAKLKALLLKK